MSVEDKDHDTWVYHALHEAKIVKASEAKKLYKRGWRDSPDPKVLFKGIRGQWYKFVISERVTPHWDSYKIVMALIGVAAILALLFTHFDSK